jgi:hypothetical protein
MTVTLERKLPNDPLKVGRRCVRSAVRSCPSDRFFCSLGRSIRGSSSSTSRCCGFLNGRVKVCCNGGSGGTVAAAWVVAEAEEDPFSAFSFNFFNLLKYRSEANSVMWRGSMLSCVWPLSHPVAVLNRVVIDKAYQVLEGRRSAQEGRPGRAHGEGLDGDRNSVARLTAMHRGIRRERPRPTGAEDSGRCPEGKGIKTSA